jgi:cytochrome c peroxidase
VNRGYGTSFFWDGRAGSLEEAVLLPIANPRELDLPLDSLVARLAADPRYWSLFLEAYGKGPSRGTVAGALASFVRLIRSGDAPIDRLRTAGSGALSPEARRGRRLFLGKAGCFACHSGPNLTDEAFHDTGVAARSAAGGGAADPGRTAITGREEDRGTFKTPTLREVAGRAPYMHDGSLSSLEEVVRFYDRGGGPSPSLDPEIRSLDLSEREIGDLVAFLVSLGGRLEAPGADGRPVTVGRPGRERVEDPDSPEGGGLT